MKVKDQLNEILKRALNPFRVALGRFVISPNHLVDSDSIFYKAASIIAAEKIQGDYLEFGSF